MAIAGVFFDLGGTLFSYRNVARTNAPLLVESAKRLGANADERAIKHAYSQASKEIAATYAAKRFYLHRDLFEDMFSRFCELLGCAHDRFVHQWYKETQHHALLDCLELKPNCVETLRSLKQRGLYTSICSNIDDRMLDPLLERESLRQHFDHCTSSEAAGSCKPDAAFFEHVLEKSKLAPSDVMFVGDSLEHDICGANAAGMTTVLIVEHGIEAPLQSGKSDAQPDHTIEDLAELDGLISAD